MAPMWEGSASATPDSRARSASFDTTSVRCQTATAKGTAWMGAASVPKDTPGSFVRQVRFFLTHMALIEPPVSFKSLYFKNGSAFNSRLRAMEAINQIHNKLLQVFVYLSLAKGVNDALGHPGLKFHCLDAAE